MRGLSALAALAAAGGLALGGCGAGLKAADLFAVTRTGGGPQLTLVVDEEGGLTCDGTRKGKVTDKQLVVARGIQEELSQQATEGLTLPPRSGSVYSYDFRDENGSIRFADDSSGLPKPLRELQLWVLQVSTETCHLAAPG